VTAESSATEAVLSAPARGVRWAVAVLRTARPRQWPKNLLVFAAPLAGASLGRRDGLLYALVAAAAFGFASVAVYFVNDVADAEHDRLHPRKRHRPVASGELPKRDAIVLGALCALAGLAGGLLIAEPLLTATVGAYLGLSFLYSWKLKQVPVLELLFVASGFLLRVLGGAAATHVPPSGWFLAVCSLGALGVVLAKRYTELTNLGAEAIEHRPVMRWYRPAALRLSQLAVGAGMIAAYLAWAASEHAEARSWHLASALPLVAALARFAFLTGRRTTAPVEDLLTRDGPMLACEACWLALFVVGLLTERWDAWKFSRRTSPRARAAARRRVRFPACLAAPRRCRDQGRFRSRAHARFPSAPRDVRPGDHCRRRLGPHDPVRFSQRDQPLQPVPRHANRDHAPRTLV